MQKKLKIWDGVMIVMGSMIGSGIFLVSADAMRNLGSGYWLISIWLITGLFMVSAALCYGELSALFPKAGGQYTYLTQIYGKLIGFLYGWGMFSVIQTGTIAAVAVAFAKYSAYLFPIISTPAPLFKLNTFEITWVQILAIGVILLLTYINTRGIEAGKWIQSLFTSSKIIALVGLIFMGLFLVKESFLQENFLGKWSAFQFTIHNETSGWVSINKNLLLGAIASAMVGSVFSSIAWENVTFVSEEIENPTKNVVRSMLIGTIAVMFLYILSNLAYLNVLSRDEIAFAKNDRVAIALAEKMTGTLGTTIMAFLVMISTFGCVNGIVLSGARLFQTMAKNGLFLKQALKNNKNEVPQNALWMQGIWASLLCLSGQYGDLLDMISFVIVLFYMLCVFGVIYLRIKQPHLERPYKTRLYPLPAIIFIAIGLLFCGFLMIYKPQYTWPGFLIILLGIPIYFLFEKKTK